MKKSMVMKHDIKKEYKEILMSLMIYLGLFIIIVFLVPFVLKQFAIGKGIILYFDNILRGLSSSRVDICIGLVSVVFITASFLAFLSNKEDTVYWENIMEYLLIHPAIFNFLGLVTMGMMSIVTATVGLVFTSRIDIIVTSFVLGIISTILLFYKVIWAYFGRESIKLGLTEKLHDLIFYKQNGCEKKGVDSETEDYYDDLQETLVADDYLVQDELTDIFARLYDNSLKLLDANDVYSFKENYAVYKMIDEWIEGLEWEEENTTNKKIMPAVYYARSTKEALILKMIEENVLFACTMISFDTDIDELWRYDLLFLNKFESENAPSVPGIFIKQLSGYYERRLKMISRSLVKVYKGKITFFDDNNETVKINLDYSQYLRIIEETISNYDYYDIVDRINRWSKLASSSISLDVVKWPHFIIFSGMKAELIIGNSCFLDLILYMNTLYFYEGIIDKKTIMEDLLRYNCMYYLKKQGKPVYLKNKMLRDPLDIIEDEMNKNWTEIVDEKWGKEVEEYFGFLYKSIDKLIDV